MTASIQNHGVSPVQHVGEPARQTQIDPFMMDMRTIGTNDETMVNDSLGTLITCLTFSFSKCFHP